jgi:FkbM family methyltransferase
MRVGPGGQVAAFEPNPESFARLERHRKLNRLGWLKTYRAAASDHSGSAELLTYGDLGSTSTHLRYDDEAESQNSAPIGIRTIRLDDLVETGELRPPMFIKVDVEGQGHHALEGMRASLARSHPVLIVGFHSKAEVDGVLGVLEPLGYRRTPIAAPPVNPESLIGGDYLFTP